MWMQKKKNTKFKGSDFFLTLLCLSGMLITFFLFWKDLNLALTRLSEEPIAVITFKRHSAQRKFVDRVIWDKLRQESPIYDEDTIRTAPLSEAVIRFPDGNQIELQENTLVQVFLKESTAAVELAAGGVIVTAAQSSSGVALVAGETQAVVNKGAVVNAVAPFPGTGKKEEEETEKESSGTVRLTVQEGTVSVKTPSEQQFFSPGSSVCLSGKKAAVLTPEITVLYPPPCLQLLQQEKGSSLVAFQWKTAWKRNPKKIYIETASDRKFHHGVKRQEVSEKVAHPLSFPAGTHYWRIYLVGMTKESTDSFSDSAEEVSSGKVRVIEALPPKLIAPDPDYPYSYRNRLPGIRFLWTGNDGASSYQLQIADNAEMKNPRVQQRTAQPSSIISSLDAGTWYWQVTPFYPINQAGLAFPSEVASFTINQSGALQSVKLMTPKAEGDVDLNKMDSGIYFSWENDDEAVCYTLFLGKENSLSQPLFSSTTFNNYLVIKPGQFSISPGRWYWSVYQTDVEGNQSKISEVRSFVAAYGEMIQKTMYPPDGYQVSENLMADIRFTWKTNLPFTTRFQISSQSDFSELLIDEINQSGGTQGKNLPVGEYYWRIFSEEKKVHQTSAKRLNVVPLLNKTKSIFPLSESKVILRDEESLVLRWEPVPGADYYHVRLFDQKKTGTADYECFGVEDAFLTIPSGFLSEGEHLWTVQAFAQERWCSSRRAGVLGEFRFGVKKLHSVRLEAPATGTELDGLTAAHFPTNFRWSTIDPVGSSRFILSYVKDGKSKIVFQKEDPKSIVSLSHLKEGKYYWTIEAKTAEGFDISAKKPVSFVVLPIPPLPTPSWVKPEAGHVVGARELKEERKLTFQWEDVPGATAYRFVLMEKKNPLSLGRPKKILETVLKGGKTCVVLEDLTFLHQGVFIWEVEALAFLEGGSIERRGIKRKTELEIRLPLLRKPKVKIPEELYGN